MNNKYTRTNWKTETMNRKRENKSKVEMLWLHRHVAVTICMVFPIIVFTYPQNECYSLEGIDEVYEFLRLKKSMEMVGFTADVQKR